MEIKEATGITCSVACTPSIASCSVTQASLPSRCNPQACPVTQARQAGISGKRKRKMEVGCMSERLPGFSLSLCIFVSVRAIKHQTLREPLIERKGNHCSKIF
eukprot:g20484.t1